MSTRPRTESDVASASAFSCAVSRGREQRRGRCRHHVRLAAGLESDLLVLAVAERYRERHGERDQRQQEHVGQRQQQTPAQAYGSISSGGLKRKPTPRTVCR